MAGDLGSLNKVVAARSRRNVRLILALIPIAAAMIVAVAIATRAPAAKPTEIARSIAPRVSVRVSPGTRAAVFTTKDPKVTVVWISNERGL
jgi:hypothetical protein